MAVAAALAGAPVAAGRTSVLQLGLFQREGDAWWAWQSLVRRAPQIAAELTPLIAPLDAQRRGDGFVLRARLEPGSTAELAGLCRRILGLGLGCLVVDAPASPPPEARPLPVYAPRPDAKPAVPPPADATPTALPRGEPQQVIPPRAALPTAEAPRAMAPPPAAETAVSAVAEAVRLPPVKPQPHAATAVASAAVTVAPPPVTTALAITAPPPPVAPPAAAVPDPPSVPGVTVSADGLITYSDEDAKVMAAIERRARRQGRLGAVLPDTKFDLTPAALTRENWNLCAVTFDDGPHRTVTRAILDIVNAEKIKVTYFPVAQIAARYPDIIRDFLAAGHEIGNHSLAHADMRAMKPDAQRVDVAESNHLLRRIGANPVLFRPPYGRYNADLLATIRANHMIPVLWNVDTRDWKVRDPDKIVQHVKTAAGSGSVLLLHSTYASTAAALPRVIADLRQKGCEFVTLSEWIERMHQIAAPMLISAGIPQPSPN